jgi:hypothetical protein
MKDAWSRGGAPTRSAVLTSKSNEGRQGIPLSRRCGAAAETELTESVVLFFRQLSPGVQIIEVKNRVENQRIISLGLATINRIG